MTHPVIPPDETPETSLDRRRAALSQQPSPDLTPLQRRRKFLEDSATADRAASLQATRDLAASFSPAQGAEAFDISGRIRVTPSAALESLDTFRTVPQVPFDPETFARRSPTTAQWLSDLANAAVAKGDEEALGWLERNLGRDWHLGLADLDLSVPSAVRVALAPSTMGLSLLAGGTRDPGRIPLAAQASVLDARASRLRGRASLFTGGDWASSSLAPRIRELEAEAQGVRERMPEAGSGFLERSLVGGAGALSGSIVESARGFVEGAIPGAAAGAAGTWWLGPIAPFTTAGVAVTGGHVGRANAMRELMAGEAVKVLDQAERETGVRFSRGQRFAAEQTYGIVGGAIEYLQMGSVARGLGGQHLMNGAIRQMLASPTAGRALGRAALAYGTNLGEQVVQESLQQGGVLLAEHLVRTGAGVEGVSGERALAELLETAGETAIASALIPLPGVGISLVDGMMQVREAQETADRIRALGDGFEAVGLRARSPEAFRQWATMVKKQEGAVDQLYAPVEELRALFQKPLDETPEVGVERSPADEAAQVAAVVRELGLEREWAEAEATGGKVAIPLETVARLTGTPLWKPLSKHLTFRAEDVSEADVAPTAEALAEWQAEMDALDMTTVTERREQEVIQRGIDALTATGTYTESQVRTQVETLYKPFIVLARRFAKENPNHRWADPVRLLEDRGLTILGPDRAEVLYDTHRRYEAAKQSGADESTLLALRVKLDRVADARVDLRTAMRTLDQTGDIRDAEGRLAKSLSRVSDEALVLEYLSLRGVAQEAGGRLAAMEAALEAASEGNVATAEERVGVIQAAGLETLEMQDAESFEAKAMAFDAYERQLRARQRRAERSLPRLEAELTKRGITDPDTLAEERGFGLDASFDPSQMGTAFEQVDFGGMWERVQATVLSYMGNSAPVRQMRMKLIERDRRKESREETPTDVVRKAEWLWGRPRAGMTPLEIALVEEAAVLKGHDLTGTNPDFLPVYDQGDLMSAAFSLGARGELQRYDRWTGTLLRQAAFRDFGMSSNRNAITGLLVGEDGKRTLEIPAEDLLGVRGARGEESRIDSAKVRELAESMKERGFNADDAVAIDVDPDGATVYEGNHRIRAAQLAGVPVKAEIRYFSGATPDVWMPESLRERTEFLKQSAPEKRPNAFIIPQKTQQWLGLMETANLSSFAHEMGHEYLNLLAFVAQDPEAPQSIKDDLATVLKELGVASVADIGEKEQEHFARSFERYLYKGEAPSRDLARAFEKFRVWLTNVYHALKAMMTKPVSPELAGVFDRMLATDEEIAEWRGSPEAQPMLLSVEDAAKKGMPLSDAQFEAYRTKYAWNAQATGSRVLADVLEETTDARRQAWQEIRFGVEADVMAFVDGEPIEQAVQFLRTTNEDGTKPNLLDRALLVALYGPSATKTLPRRIVAAKGDAGLDLDTVAARFGFRDGTAFYRALQGYEERADRIRRLTDETMARRFGSLLDDSAALTQATEDAAHRSEQDEALLADLEILGRTLGIEVPTTRAKKGGGRQSLDAVKLAAQRVVGQTVGLMLDPNKYLRQERKAARLAERELRKGKPDLGKVAALKRQQLLNRILYREARKAEDASDKALAFFRRMSETTAQERLGKAGPSYRDAMNALLEDIEFKQVSGRRLDRRALLAEWVKTVRTESSSTGKPEDGVLQPAVPPSVLEDAELVNYRQLTVDELAGMHETGEQIWHTATRKDALMKAVAKRTLLETAEALKEEAGAHRALAQRSYLAEADKTVLDKAKGFARSAHFGLLKPEMLLRLLDGDVANGLWQRALMRPMSESQHAQTAKLRTMAELLQAAMPDSVRARFAETVEIPGAPRPVSIETCFVVALNLGNAGNRQAMLDSSVDGRPTWYANPKAIDAMLSALTVEELRGVQATWDAIDTLWPEVKALEERMVGVAPEKVEAMPLTVTAKDGTVVQLRGGYYPLAYDPAFSDKSKRDVAMDEALSLQTMPVAYGNAQTRHGHTERRVGSGKRPVQLDLGVLSRHVYAVVHDLTHREAVYDASRLLNQSDVADAVTQTFGAEALGELRKWVRRIAGEPAGPRHLLDRVLTEARAGVTATAMGMKATTTVLQFLGVVPALDFLGPKWLGVGVQAWARDPRGLTKMVQAMSAEMANRADNIDREVRDAIRRKGALTRSQELAFWSIQQADQIVVTQVWWGAYQKALSENQSPADAVEAADSTVRLTQGSGAAKDLASAQDGSPIWKAFTMFYSYGSALYAMYARTGTNVAEGRWGAGRAAMSLMVLWMIPAVIEPLISGRAPDDDEDEFWQWWLWNVTTYPLQAIPFVRDVARAYQPGNRSFGAKVQASPILSALDTVARAAGSVADAVTGDELSRGEINSIVTSAGYFLKLPTAQATISFWAMVDWMTGRDEPDRLLPNPNPFSDDRSVPGYLLYSRRTR